MMKKYVGSLIILFIFVCISLILTSCAEAKITQSTTEVVTTELVTTTQAITTPTEGPIVSVGVVMHSIDDYDEYLAYISETAVPENFISYEMIKKFGEFRSFQAVPYGENNPTHTMNPNYGYGYDLEFDGLEITFDINEKDSDFEYATVSAPTTNDLQIHENKESGVWQNGKFEYHYVQGKLLYIEWEYNDVRYALSSRNSAREYDYTTLSSDSVLSKLVHRDTCEEAFQEIFEMLG